MADLHPHPAQHVLVTSSEDGQMHAYDFSKRSLLHSLKVKDEAINRISINPNNTLEVAMSCDTSSTIIARMDTHDILYIQNGHSASLWDVKYSHNGKLLATSSEDQRVVIRKTNNITEITGPVVLNHHSAVLHLSFTLDDSILITGCSDGTCSVWSLASNDVLCSHLGHTQPVSALCVSDNGVLAASGCADSMVRVWRVMSGRLQSIHSVAKDSSVCSLIFSKDNKFVISGSSKGSLLFHHVALFMNTRSIALTDGFPINSIVHSPTKDELIIGSGDGSVCVYNIAAFQRVYDFPRHASAVFSVAVSSLLSEGNV